LLDLTDKADLQPLARLIADLRSAAPDVDVLLVGAMARDVLLLHAHGIDTRRATEDIDLAFAIRDWKAFNELRERLLASGHFIASSSVLHRLRHVRLDIQLDLIPFDGVEDGEGRIAWPPDFAEVMQVFGYREARASAITAQLPLGQSLALVALPVFVMLKIFAWIERHRIAPRKDAVDLALVLSRYLEAGNADRLYAEAPQLFEPAYEDDFDLERAGAWLCGRDARAVLDQHSSRIEQLLAIMNGMLEREMDPNGPLVFIGQAKYHAPEALRRLLAAFHAGLNLQITP
jgi:predicted nucleotidyltransferase